MGKGKIVEATTRRARAVRRSKLGSLASLTVKPATLQRYTKALERFFSFLAWNKLPLAASYEQLDNHLCQFVEHLWEEGDPRGYASDCLAGMQNRLPHVRRHIPGSWRLLKAWNQHELPARAPPLAPQHVNAISAFFLQRGFPSLALAVQVGFYALLRTGELLQLQAHHVQVRKGHQAAVLNLNFTKMSARAMCREAVTVNQPALVSHLLQWRECSASSRYLVNVPQSQFRKLFREALDFVGLPHTFKPYSLRRGGATYMFQITGSHAQVCQAGRWSSERTARIYISDSMAIAVELTHVLSSQAKRVKSLFWESALEPRLYDN